MDIDGEFHIPAPRERVWEALNDPEVLGQAIPGCKEIDKLSDTEFTARVVVKVGPVKAPFKGKVTLSELDPPNGYKITGEGQGGVAGFARGDVSVRLVDHENGTLLSYAAQVNVGGKLAQVGQRLLDSTAKKLSGEFFRAFSEQVGAPAAEPAAEVAPEPVVTVETADSEAAASSTGLSPWLWVGGILVVVAALLAVFGL